MKRESDFTWNDAGTICRACTAGLFLVFAISRAGTAQGVLFQGIADVEAWNADSSSRLLARNNGNPGVLFRLQVWSAVELGRHVVAYAQGEVEGGSASNEDEKFRPELYRLGLRYSPSTRFVVDAGKLNHPMSIFAARRFSTRNPLIGSPDGYTPQYPLAVQISGSAGRFDYRLAGSSLPVSHEGYVPEPGVAWRPVILAGVTPFIGFRIGASAMLGPYLNNGYGAAQLYGKPWKSYRQGVAATDWAFSKGYFEMYGEYSYSSYDVPGYAERVTGTDTYLEGKYTFKPRVYVAARVERNLYPFVRTAGPTRWNSARTDFDNLEVGVGYRTTASSLAKFTYRVDKWKLTEANRAFLGPGGQAFAVQFSQAFDVLSLLAHPE